jgi:hypothetical protein
MKTCDQCNCELPQSQEIDDIGEILCEECTEGNNWDQLANHELGEGK